MTQKRLWTTDLVRRLMPAAIAEVATQVVPVAQMKLHAIMTQKPQSLPMCAIIHLPV
jgi:hypothetical protein